MAVSSNLTNKGENSKHFIYLQEHNIKRRLNSSKNINSQQKRSELVFSQIRRYFPYITFILPLILYLNTIGHEYVLDDIAITEANTYVKKGIGGLVDIFTHSYWHGYLGIGEGSYRPIPVTIQAILFEFWGFNPSIAHAVNVLLYALTGFLLFQIQVKLLNWKNPEQQMNDILAFIITILFISHPIHTEVVANIKSVDEILCFLFFILSALYLTKYIDQKNNKALVFSIGFYFCSLLSKETAITFVLAFPLILWFYTHLSFREVLKHTLFFLSVLIFYLVIRHIILGNLDSGINEEDLKEIINNSLFSAKDYSIRFCTSIGILGMYLKLIIFPHPLLHDYSFNQIPLKNWDDLNVVLSFSIIIFLLVYAFYTFKNKNIFSFAILFFFLTISIVSNVFVLIGSTMAERFLYAPVLGYCIILGHIICNFIFNKRNSPFLTYGVLTLIVCLYSFKSISRNKVWKNALLLHSTDIPY